MTGGVVLWVLWVTPIWGARGPPVQGKRQSMWKREKWWFTWTCLKWLSCIAHLSDTTMLSPPILLLFIDQLLVFSSLNCATIAFEAMAVCGGHKKLLASHKVAENGTSMLSIVNKNAHHEEGGERAPHEQSRSSCDTTHFPWNLNKHQQ